MKVRLELVRHSILPFQNHKMEQPNLDYIRTLSGGETSFEKQLIGIIQKELPDEISLYNDHMDSGDLASAAQSVHKLKHKISILGMTQAYELAIAYENALNEGLTDQSDTFDQVLEQMSRFINELSI